MLHKLLVHVVVYRHRHRQEIYGAPITTLKNIGALQMS